MSRIARIIGSWFGGCRRDAKCRCKHCVKALRNANVWRLAEIIKLRAALHHASDDYRYAHERAERLQGEVSALRAELAVHAGLGGK